MLLNDGELTANVLKLEKPEKNGGRDSVLTHQQTLKYLHAGSRINSPL